MTRARSGVVWCRVWRPGLGLGGTRHRDESMQNKIYLCMIIRIPSAQPSSLSLSIFLIHQLSMR